MQFQAPYALARLAVCGAFMLSVSVLGVSMGSAPVMAASAFSGHWVGPWQDAKVKQSGSFLLAIDGRGAIEGIMTNGATHGVVRGEISERGELSAVYSFDGTTFYAAKGSFARHGSHLRGTARYFTSANKPIGSSALDLQLAKEKQDPDAMKIAQPSQQSKPEAPRGL